MSEPAPIPIRAAREGDGARLGALHVEAWRESYPGLVPAALLASLSVDDRTTMWDRLLSDRDGPDRTTVFLAEDGRRLAGFAACGPQRSDWLRAEGYAGEIGAIYVSGFFQNRGLGRRLMAVAGAALRDRGLAAAALWVLRDNHRARRFYERLGGRQVGARETVRGEHVLAEVAYGWPEPDVAGGPAASGR